MKTSYLIGAAAGVLGFAGIGASAQAAPLGAAAQAAKAEPGQVNAEQVHWRGRHYRQHRRWGYYGYPRYRQYGYGYAPGFNFYIGPRHRGYW